MVDRSLNSPGGGTGGGGDGDGGSGQQPLTNDDEPPQLADPQPEGALRGDPRADATRQALVDGDGLRDFGERQNVREFQRESAARGTAFEPDDLTIAPNPQPDAALRGEESARRSQVLLTGDGVRDAAEREARREGRREAIARGNDFGPDAVTVLPNPQPDAALRGEDDAQRTQVSLTDEAREELLAEQQAAMTGSGDGPVPEPIDVGETEGPQESTGAETRLDVAAEGPERTSPTIGSIGGGLIDVTSDVTVDPLSNRTPDVVASPAADAADATLDVAGDATSAVAGAPGVTQGLSAVRGFGETVGEASGSAADSATSFIDSLDPQPGQSVVQDIFTSSVTKGAVDTIIGAPESVTNLAASAEDAFQGTQENVKEEGIGGGLSLSGEQATEATGATLGTAVATAKEQPLRTAGFVAGGAAAGTAAAPAALRAASATSRAVPNAPSGGTFSLGDARGVTVGLDRSTGKVTETQPLLTVSSKTPGRTPFETGTPRVDLDRALGDDTIEPQLGGAETAALTRSLRAEGFDDDAEAIEAARGVQRQTQEADLQPEAVDPVVGDVLERQGLSREGASEITDVMVETDTELKGSIVQTAAGKEVEEPGVGRVPRDIDVITDDPEGFAGRIGERLGDEVEVDGSDITSAATGEKLFDVLEPGEFDPGQSSRLGGGEGQQGDVAAFGLRFEDEVETEEGVTTTTLSDQTARKAQGALKEIGASERKVTTDSGLSVEGAVTPRQPGRIKDIPDFFVGEQANIKQLELQGDDAAASQARGELGRFIESFGPDVADRARREYREALEEGDVEFRAAVGDGDADTRADSADTEVATASGTGSAPPLTDAGDRPSELGAQTASSPTSSVSAASDADSPALTTGPAPRNGSSPAPTDSDSGSSFFGGSGDSGSSALGPGESDNSGLAPPSSPVGGGGDGGSSFFGGGGDGGSSFFGGGSDGGSSFFGGGSDGGSSFFGGGSDGGSSFFGGGSDGGGSSVPGSSSSSASSVISTTPGTSSVVTPATQPQTGGGNKSPRLPSFDDDDDGLFDVPTGDSAEAEFTNPVASVSEVLSSDAEGGGQRPETGNDGPALSGLFGGGRR